MLSSAVLWLLCVCFFEPPRPRVGVYIAGLGCLAVVVTIWSPESRWSKAAWLAVFFVLTALEITTLYQDRTENQRAQATARAEERNSFASIANGINTAITNSQIAFAATMERMAGLADVSAKNLRGVERSVDLITGAGSVPFFMVQLTTRTG